MMKRILFFIFLVGIVFSASSQYGNFFRGIGIFVGPNTTAHTYINAGALAKDPNNPVFNDYYPQNHTSGDYINLGAGILLEFLRYDRIRWQTEIEYTGKGAVEKERDWLTGTEIGLGVNTYQYIQWNNYLKYFWYQGDRGDWYVMVGGKLEFNFSRSTPIYAAVAGTFPAFWFSGDVAIGREFFTWKRFHPFIELHWNPDLFFQPPRITTTVISRTFELRFGIIYRPLKKSIDDCNAPKYHGNYN